MTNVQRAIMEAKEDIKLRLGSSDLSLEEMKAVTYGFQFLTTRISGITPKVYEIITWGLREFEKIAKQNELAGDDTIKYYEAIEVAANTINTRCVDLLKNL